VTAASTLDSLLTQRPQLEPSRKVDWNDGECCAGVHEKFHSFGAPGRASQSRGHVKESHDPDCSDEV